MPIADQVQEPLSWLAEDELNELNEEWIDNSSARSNSVSGEGDTGTINMKSTYDSIIIHENDENATTKLNHGVKKDATAKWKKALQDQNSMNNNKNYSTWNNFFQSPNSQQNSEIEQTGSRSGSVVEKRGTVGTGSTTIPTQIEDTGSKSRLKVFQKHDTYTHSRLENLLGALDLRSPHASLPVRPESAKLLNDSVSNQSQHKSVNSDSDLHSSRYHEHMEWNSVDRRDITTQDFMDNANSLMKKLMGGGLDQLEASPTGDSNFQTDSYESGGSNFMDNSYQNSDQELGPPIYNDHGVGQRDQGSERHASVIVHPKEPLKPAENKRNIAVIKQEDVKNIIPETIGSMNYDAENRIWRRNGKKQSSTNVNESSVAHNSTQEENDVFQGIDDLSDNIGPPSPTNPQQSRQPSRHNAPVQSQSSKLEPDDSLQQKLLSIKSCLIDTPRAAMVSGVSDKEVSFLLPGREARPILAAVGVAKPFNGDVTHISQIDTSFSHSMTHLVRALTDKYPNQMLWDKLVYIDISNCRFESMAKLNLICPSLKKLNASRNSLSVVQGIPASVTDLDVSNNNLSNLSNFGGLQNLQYLNISSNNMASFTCMSSLLHLRNLTADDCRFTNLNGLNGIEGLMQLSLQGCQLTELDGSQCPSSFLQSINVSNNKIRRVKNLDLLKSLRSLNLGRCNEYNWRSFLLI